MHATGLPARRPLEPPVVRGDVPPRGAVLRLEPVDLPSVEDRIGVGSGPERERWRRDNVARRTYRLVERDGTPVRVGLFVAVDVAEAFAREHGWTVLTAGLGVQSTK
jgi:hypothetical protein